MKWLVVHSPLGQIADFQVSNVVVEADNIVKATIEAGKKGVYTNQITSCILIELEDSE